MSSKPRQNDDGLPGIELGREVGAQVCEEHVQVVLVVLEKVFDVVPNLEEVYEDVALVFFLGEFLDDVALAHAAGAFYHHG